MNTISKYDAQYYYVSLLSRRKLVIILKYHSFTTSIGNYNRPFLYVYSLQSHFTMFLLIIFSPIPLIYVYTLSSLVSFPTRLPHYSFYFLSTRLLSLQSIHHITSSIYSPLDYSHYSLTLDPCVSCGQVWCWLVSIIT